MLKRYYSLWLTLAGIVGFSIGVAIKTTWEESKFIIGQWKDDPIIIVCPDSQVSNYRIHKAVEWWGIRGYDFAYVHFDNENV